MPDTEKAINILFEGIWAYEWNYIADKLKVSLVGKFGDELICVNVEG